MRNTVVGGFCVGLITWGVLLCGAEPHAWFNTDFEVGFVARGGAVPVEPSGHPAVELLLPQGEVLLTAVADVIEYDLPSGFPVESGSIEWIFGAELSTDESLPDFPLLAFHGAGGEGVVLALVAAGLSIFQLSAEYPADALRERQRFGMVYRRDWLRRHEGNSIHHIVLTWDEAASPHPVTRLFINGEQSRWRGSGQIFTPPFPDLRRLEIRGADGSTIRAGNLAIYDQPLQDELVTYAASLVAEGRHSVAAVEREGARLARVAERERVEREALIDQLEGRVGRIVHSRGHSPRDFDFPGGIVATGIRPEDIGVIDLSRFLVIYGPQGGRYELTPEQEQLIVNFVDEGGGYVGSCQGAYFARRSGMLDFETVGLFASGLFNIELEPHPVTAGYGERVIMHHGNGPVMIPRGDGRVIGAYPIPGERDQRGAILVGERGKGRVVLFGSHPLGGTIGKVAHVYAKDNQVARYGPEEQGTVDIFVNSLLYAAGLINEE